MSGNQTVQLTTCKLYDYDNNIVTFRLQLFRPGEGLVTLAFTNNSQALSVTFPTKYLGDKRTSYGSYLTFDMNVDSEVVESIYLRMNGEKTRRSQVKLSASLEGIRSNRTEYKVTI